MVWAEKPGTVQLKLEGGAGGDDNWERVLPIPATGQWVKMEWDVLCQVKQLESPSFR
jgi:hypothetical protein